MPSTDSKLLELDALLRGYLQDGLIVAFSGGVDSAFLLWAASMAQKQRQGQGRLLALTTVSFSVPARDIEDARRLAEKLEVDHELHHSTEFGNEEYLKNDALRCYHCKTELFRISGELLASRPFHNVAYGYTASDVDDIRPGHRAAREHGVLYPLADLGFTKDEIRREMTRNGFAIADKPASPCLSSRVMTGIRISGSMLKDIEDLESKLRDGGLEVFRVRHHEDRGVRFLRLEVAVDEMEKAVRLRGMLAGEAKKRGYRWITLDLEGYRTGGANR